MKPTKKMGKKTEQSVDLSRLENEEFMIDE
jgi:hypothetical protein